MESLLKTVGEKIRLIRQNRSLTQEDVAELLNISHSTYAKLERGETDMTLKRLDEIATAFGTSPIEILQLHERISNSPSNHNNQYSAIGDNSQHTITLPFEASAIEDLQKQFAMLDLALQKSIKRIEFLEKKWKER